MLPVINPKTPEDYLKSIDSTLRNLSLVNGLARRSQSRTEMLGEYVSGLLEIVRHQQVLNKHFMKKIADLEKKISSSDNSESNPS